MKEAEVLDRLAASFKEDAAIQAAASGSGRPAVGGECVGCDGPTVHPYLATGSKFCGDCCRVIAIALDAAGKGEG